MRKPRARSELLVSAGRRQGGSVKVCGPGLGPAWARLARSGLRDQVAGGRRVIGLKGRWKVRPPGKV